MLQPILTVALAMWFLSETLTLPLVVSAAAIIVGTGFAQRAAASRPTRPGRDGEILRGEKENG